MLLDRSQIPTDLAGFFEPAECGECWTCRLVEVFREVRRVLRKDGTLWVEIGDSYASQGGERIYGSHDGAVGRGDAVGPRISVDGIKPKDLIGAPWLLAFAMRADGWYLRSEIIWSKPNPMPESVTDRPTTAHSRVFLFAKSKAYYYDAEAIREPNVSPEQAEHTARYAKEYPAYDEVTADLRQPGNTNHKGIHARGGNTVGRNRRSVWEIPTQPYPEAHFAVWPEKLVEPMILAGTSEKGVCPECGAPWERVVESTPALPERERYAGAEHVGPHRGGGDRPGGFYPEAPTTTGWLPTCEHQAGNAQDGYAPRTPVPATVLDPFAGSGTTAYVARRLGRRSVGIDLSAEYLGLAARRLQQQSIFA